MKKSYYKKLLFLYSAVFFVLTVVFSGIYFVNTNRLETERINEQNQVLFMDYVKTEEEKLAALIRNSNKIAAWNSTMSYAISNGTDYYRKMIDLRDDLAMLGGNGTKTLYFVQKKNDKNCVTNYQSTLMAVQLTEFEITEAQYGLLIAAFGRNDLQNYQFIYTEKGILYLTTKTINNNRVHIGVFTIYDQLKKYDESTYASFCMTDGITSPDFNSTVDLRTRKTKEGEGKSAGEEMIEGLEGDTQTIGTWEEGGSYYYYIDSKYSNSRYYFCTENLSLTVFSSMIEYLPFVLITTVLGFSVILYISKKLYAPIEDLVNIMLDMEDQGAEKKAVGSDIEYLARQVSQIRYENQDLTRTLKESRNQTKNRLISDILRGTFDESAALGELANYEMEWLNEVNYIVMGETVLQDMEEADEIHARVAGIVREHLSRAFRTEGVNFRDGNSYYIVQSDTLEELEEVLSGLIAAINTALGLEIIFYVSKRSKSLEDLHYSFMTIEKVRENSLSEGKRAIYDFRDVKQSRHPAVIYSVNIENKLLGSIEKGNEEEMERILEYIFKEYVSLAFLNEQNRNMIISAFANTANRCLERFSVNAADVLAHGDTVYGYLNGCGDLEDFEKRSRSLFNGIYDQASDGRERKEHELKPRIESYMRANILEDISLVSMADYFKLTPNYMSAIFKSVMGETFKDYTSKCRFELGVRYLLDHPEATLNELAEKTGLNSTATLIRLFKKYGGCSPARYAEQLQKEAER